MLAPLEIKQRYYEADVSGQKFQPWDELASSSMPTWASKVSIWGFMPDTKSFMTFNWKQEIWEAIKGSICLTHVNDIQLLEDLYTFHDPIEIKRFLFRQDRLTGALFEIQAQIKRIFRNSVVELSLEYDRDPEENFEGLSAILKTNLSPELSLDLLDKFDEEWWLDVDDEIRTILTVMVRPL